MTLQFFSDDTDEETCIWVDEHTGTQAFFDWCETVPRHCLNVVYCHNLDFDLPEFLWSLKEQLITLGGDFTIETGGWLIRGVYGRPTFCRMKHRKSSRMILIVDSFLWFQGTLAKAAELFCPDLPKLKRPAKLGSKKFPMSDDTFYAYAMRDAEVAYHIGKSVQQLIREFDIMQPVSLADMSAKIFRHHFLKRTIPQPSRVVIEGALKSYHGGKNNVVPGAAPGWHMDVSAFDISSAYPYAMSQLPSMSLKRGYKRYARTLKNPRSVPPLGVYQCSGTATDCDWPVIFQHGFQPIRGKFRNVWIQGIELNEALASGEVKLTCIRGHYYDSDRDSFPSPFKAYCDDFYERKQAEKNPVRRYMFKTILNSVYGKFIQTHKQSRIIYTDCDSGETKETHDLIAGGMFHPFIASAITAHTRAYIHQLEHRHKAIHTATDGIYTKYKRIQHVPMAPKTGLGKMEIEGRGDLVLLRNKCYILYSPNGKIKSQVFKGKRIHKFAKHGFQGTVIDLEDMVAHGHRRYIVNRPNRLKESLKRGLAVNEFVKRSHILKVGRITVKS
jgi:hypothetical protein